MKIEFYFDVYPWTTGKGDIVAFTSPVEKEPNATRYKVEVDIPDPTKPDAIIEGNAVEVAS